MQGCQQAAVARNIGAQAYSAALGTPCCCQAPAMTWLPEAGCLKDQAPAEPAATQLH